MNPMRNNVASRAAPVSFDVSIEMLKLWAARMSNALEVASVAADHERSGELIREALGWPNGVDEAKVVLDEKRFSNLARRVSKVAPDVVGAALTHKQARDVLGKALGWETEHHVAAALKGTDAGPPTDGWIDLQRPASHDEDASLPSASRFCNDPRGYFRYLEQLGLADVRHNALKGDVFVDVTIEGVRFKGQISGLYPVVASYHAVHGFEVGWVQYGVASIDCARTEGLRSETRAWAICKYNSQPRVPLQALSVAGIRRLAVELGLVINPWLPEGADQPAPADVFAPEELSAFFESKAFDAIVQWAKAHPRKIKQHGQNTYSFDWALRAATAAKEL